MYARLQINNELWPVEKLYLTEGINEGWTFSAKIPGLTDRPFSQLSLEVSNDNNNLNISMAPESSLEDYFGMELSGRDKASHKLSHAYFDGTSLHLMSVTSALNALCSNSSIGTAGAPRAMNIHYASTDVQPSLDLINDLLNTSASRFNSNGSQFTFAPIALNAPASHILTDVLSVTFSIDHEAYKGSIRLNKTTPCDINDNVVISRDIATVDESGQRISTAVLSCNAPDNTEWLKMCQSAVFDPEEDPDHLILADGTKVNLAKRSFPLGTFDNEGKPQEGHLSRNVLDDALCIGSGEQNVSLTFEGPYTEYSPSAPAQVYHLYRITPYNSSGVYMMLIVSELQSAAAKYTVDEVPPTIEDLGEVTEKSKLDLVYKMYCCSSLPLNMFPILDTQGEQYDATHEAGQINQLYSPWDGYGVANCGPWEPIVGTSVQVVNGDINSLNWSGQKDFVSTQLEFAHSGRVFTKQSNDIRPTDINNTKAVRHLYVGNGTYLGRAERYSFPTSNIGPELPNVAKYPFWHVKRSVEIDFKHDVDLTYDTTTGEARGTGEEEDIGKFVIRLGAIETNDAFNPHAPVPSRVDDSGNVIRQTEDLYAGPLYVYEYHESNGEGGTTSSAESTLTLHAAARVVSYAVNQSWTNQSFCEAKEEIEELDLADFMPIGDRDQTQVRIVGVSKSACPSNYTPSFSADYPAKETKCYEKTSTHWQSRSAALDNASFYLWWENRNHNTARIATPLRLDIRAGELVSYQGAKYLVMSVTHSLSATEAQTEFECSAVS